MAGTRCGNASARTIFYPQGGRPRILVDALSNLNMVVPRWLQGKESASAWIQVWQLSILGHIVFFGMVLWFVRDPALALLALLPEALSFTTHLVGIHYAYRAMQTTQCNIENDS